MLLNEQIVLDTWWHESQRTIELDLRVIPELHNSPPNTSSVIGFSFALDDSTSRRSNKFMGKS